MLYMTLIGILDKGSEPQGFIVLNDTMWHMLPKGFCLNKKKRPFFQLLNVSGIIRNSNKSQNRGCGKKILTIQTK